MRGRCVNLWKTIKKKNDRLRVYENNKVVSRLTSHIKEE